MTDSDGTYTAGMPDFTPRIFNKKLEQYINRILMLRFEDGGLLMRLDEVGTDYCAGLIVEDGSRYEVILKLNVLAGFHVATAEELTEWGEGLALMSENLQ